MNPHPDDTPSPGDAHRLYREARSAMNNGDREKAAALFRESLALNPHFKTMELLGECLLERGLPREAIMPLAAATTLNPGVRAPALLARALLESGDVEGARDMAGLALSRHAENRLAREIRQKAEALLPGAE